MKKFQYPVESSIYKNGCSLIKLNISNKSKYEISFPLSQSDPLPFLGEVVLPYSLSKQDLEKYKRLIQNFNNKIKERVKETIMTDEKFLYVFCVNVTIHFERESGEDDDVNSATNLKSFDKMTT